MPHEILVNVGCGEDYREGWVNIDGSELVKADVHDTIPGALAQNFEAGSVAQILAMDVLEHLFHWEAVEFLKECFDVLTPGGGLGLKVPNVQHIISTMAMSIEEKLRYLYGGQDVPLGRMDESRAAHPEFFCHKYGWTIERLDEAFQSVGLRHASTFGRNRGTLEVVALKPTGGGI